VDRTPTASDQLVSVPAQVVNLNPKADRSWKLVFETRELNGDEVKILADNFQGEGWLLFKPNSLGITLNEIPEGDANAGVKSQSQRLRGAIMVLWKQKGGKGDPEAFYRTYMEKLIEFTKTKLDPEEA
jgi:hypothetical protein